MGVNKSLWKSLKNAFAPIRVGARSSVATYRLEDYVDKHISYTTSATRND